MNDSLSNLLSENRTFAPSAEFAAQANAKADLYEIAERDRLAFWEEQASNLHWHEKMESGFGLATTICKVVCGWKVKCFLQRT